MCFFCYGCALRDLHLSALRDFVLLLGATIRRSIPASPSSAPATSASDLRMLPSYFEKTFKKIQELRKGVEILQRKVDQPSNVAASHTTPDTFLFPLQEVDQLKRYFGRAGYQTKNVKSTCEVNITDQQSFALLTCRFSEPVKDFVLELKRSADGNKQTLGLCSTKSSLRLNSYYILIPNKEESFHSTSLGILSGADSPQGNYSSIHMAASDPNLEVHVCHLSSWKRLTGISLTSSCNADARDGLQVKVMCTFSNPVHYFQVVVMVMMMRRRRRMCACIYFSIFRTCISRSPFVYLYRGGCGGGSCSCFELLFPQ
ncbi:uncharacterized protein LOC112568045 isoform X2 [Pomacea canaliculata]|uniref:uncharacterized protein LOC112568045 isoform X2 n=1 Tax=Pomacea canaliculata TaxID=400727 RepID=UPI000D73B06D|nr:uncharacterized protein LOC112568045 isoform X2 [Pomacea canaliculata]